MPSNPSVIPFSSCLESSLASRSFPMSQFFALGGQNIGVSASVLPVNIEGWFPLGWWFDLLTVPGTLKSLLQHHSSKASIFWHSPFFIVQLSHPYMTTGKDPDAGKDWEQEKGSTEDEMAGWNHRLNGHESEQAPGVGDRQGGLACCSPWGRRESDTTEWLNWTTHHKFSYVKEFFTDDILG